MIDYNKNSYGISSLEKILFYEFLNFLEVFIHSVLYLRDVYPKEVFYDYEIYNMKFKFIIDDNIVLYISEV